MNADEASRERERLWRELKPLLVRSLGRVGAAEWLSFAGQQMAIEAKRVAQPVEVFPLKEWRP